MEDYEQMIQDKKNLLNSGLVISRGVEYGRNIGKDYAYYRMDVYLIGRMTPSNLKRKIKQLRKNNVS